MTSLPDPNLVKKAYSAGYAGFRVAQTIANRELREAVQKYSLSILLTTIDPAAGDLIRQTRKLEYIIGFGRDIGEINPQTAELILAELNKMPQAQEVAESPENGLTREDLFPDWSSDMGAGSPKTESSLAPEVIPLRGKPAGINGIHEPSESFNSRKEKILGRIRQSGNCRMKDIQEVMPEVSERTLRYDLQRLVAEEIIERVGQSGPATYYRLKAGIASS